MRGTWLAIVAIFVMVVLGMGTIALVMKVTGTYSTTPCSDCVDGYNCHLCEAPE